MSINHVIVVDSKGKAVGATIGGISLITVHSVRGTQVNPTVLLRVGQHLAAVNVDRDRFYGGTLYFQSENCTGTPWFRVPLSEGRPSLLPRVAVGPPGQTLYIETPGAASQEIPVNSKMDEDLSCPSWVTTIPAIPGQALVNLLTVFTPPFSLRAAP